jgi:hypothetical protein
MMKKVPIVSVPKDGNAALPSSFGTKRLEHRGEDDDDVPVRKEGTTVGAVGGGADGVKGSQGFVVEEEEDNSSHKEEEDDKHNTTNMSEEDKKKKFLADDYVLNDYDVVCGRGRTCYNHKGNVRFRDIVQQQLGQYMKAKSKTDKTIVIYDIIQYVRQTTPTPGGGFVKKDHQTGHYYEVGDFLAVSWNCVCVCV